MALLEQHFYHKTVNTYTAVFGTIFDKIKITRKDGKVIQVPISYASGQKYNVRNQQLDDPDAARYQSRLPRLSFMLTGMRRDPTRNKNDFHRLSNRASFDSATDTTAKTQYNRVPYVFNYRLSMKAEYIDDLLQVFEQIAVTFNPTLTVVVEDNPDLEQTTSLLIRLLESDTEDAFEGLIEEDRELELTFNFELEGYLYRPSSDSSIIKKITLNYYDLRDVDSDDDELLETDIITE